MIKLSNIATVFENGLNKALDDAEVQFKIWTNVGEFQKSSRLNNTITHYINGNLRVSTSANDATDLEMGVNGLTLDFVVPVKRPRTNPRQTSEDLAEIKDGKYPFVERVFGAVDEYFKLARSFSMKDESDKEYSISFQAGTGITGVVDLASVLGKHIGISVYIEMYFIEGGINSKDIKVEIDGITVPYRALRFGRSPVTEPNVYADKLVSKNIVTSTAFAVDVDVPLVKDNESIKEYVLDGEPNIGHFVDIRLGDGAEKLFLMTFNTVQNSAQGVAVAGVSYSLMEVADNYFNVPEGYQIREFLFENSSVDSITFALSQDCDVFIAGKAIKAKSNIAVTAELGFSDLIYDEEKAYYAVRFVTGKQVKITKTTAPYIGVFGVTDVSGKWLWNADIIPPNKALIMPISFTSNNTAFKSIIYNFDRATGVFYIEYGTEPVSTKGQRVCTVGNGVTTWTNNNFKAIDFGESEQTAGSVFYQFLIDNAKKVLNG